MNQCIFPWRLNLALALGVQFVLAPSVCRADLLPVTFASGAPVISGSNGRITYNATTGDFNATLTGPTLAYAAPFVTGNFALIHSGSLTIDLTVDQSGHFVANGTGLTLTGSVTINGALFSGTLLSGTITNFGAQPAGPPTLTFDGDFDITGGALTTTVLGTGGKPVFGGFPVGTLGGFILAAENVTGGTLGDFTHNFSSTSDKPEVGVLVPEPSTLVLLFSGAVVLIGRKKPQFWRQFSARMPQAWTLVQLLTGTLLLTSRAFALAWPRTVLRRRTVPGHAG
jgi:hypothetical protein